MNNRPRIEVCLSPLLFPLFEPQNKIVVIIDILRASSTICTILNNRARAVIPVETIGECKQYENLNDHILAAERSGEKAKGFDYGNSPLDFPESKVANKTVVLTTTNGTKAIKLSGQASHIIIGSFLNLVSLCDFLNAESRDTVLFCAGWKNHLNFEDSLFAGAVIDELKNCFHYELDSSLAVRYLYKNLKSHLPTAIKFSSHYKRLARLGVKKDIEYCLSPDQQNVLPVLSNNEIVDYKKAFA